MKLQDLELKAQTQQNQKVFESYFGQAPAIDEISGATARQMLSRVRGLLKEHRSTSRVHSSEKNPAYLKLLVLEQALTARIKEADTASPMDGDLAKGVAKVAAGTGQQGQSQKLTKAIQGTMAGKTLDSASKAALAQQMTGLAGVMKDPAMNTRLQQMLKQASAKAGSSAGATATEGRAVRGRKIMEAEVQQAQVVLAAQDMVDRVQKMIEDVSAMQFKDLPALVDSIRNEVGMDQAQQFNADATAALSGLVQNLQGSKTQLETAQGILTGQAPVVPGQDMGAEELPVDLGAVPEVDVDADIDIEEPEAEKLPSAGTLGRARR